MTTKRNAREENPHRPEFAWKIKDKFESSESNVFLLHGNTSDIHPVASGEYVHLVDFLIKDLIIPDKRDDPQKSSVPRIIIIYDPATGIEFPSAIDRQLVARELGEDRVREWLTRASVDVASACQCLWELSRNNIVVPVEGTEGKTIQRDFAIIIRYGEAVAPASAGVFPDSGGLSVITLEKWFSDAGFAGSNNIVFMISETLTGLSDRIVDLPFCTPIRIDRPNAEERGRYIDWLLEKEEATTAVPTSHLAFSSAGLSLLSIRHLFQYGSYLGTSISPELIFNKTKEIIEKELEGHIEFPHLGYGFEKVIGASKLRKKLEELRTFLLGDDPELMPVGILVPGANGVGKTYIYKAFAKECGWVAVILKNIRGPYVGQTEKNWERIRSVLEAMSNVMVMYDEADTEIGGRGARTHDVDRRLFGNILRMMSESRNRGKIVWVIITARPDRLEPDIKRSGRAGEHLPVFDNEGADKEDFLQYVMRRAGFDLAQFCDEQKKTFFESIEDYYPADFDHLVTELKRRKFLEGKLTPALVLDEVKDFIPPDVARQREFQELLAVLECTSRELLPDKYAELSREEVQARINEIRMGME